MKFALQNLRNASQIAKCEALIRTLHVLDSVLQISYTSLADALSQYFPEFNQPIIFYLTF